MERIILACALTGVLLAAGAAPVPSQPPARDAQPQEAAPRPGEPGVMKARLEQRLREVEDQRERLRRAIDMLDNGASPADALRDLDGILRPGRGEGRDRLFPGEGRPGRDGPAARPPEGHDDGPGPERLLTDEDRARVLAAVREHAPALADRIEGLMARDHEGGARLFGRMAPRLRDALEVRRRDPKAFDLRVEEIIADIGLMDAIRAYRDTRGGGDRSASRQPEERALAGLRKAVAAQFDARLRSQERETELLSERLVSFREELDRKRENRERFIDQAVERIRAGVGGRGEGPPGPDQPLRRRAPGKPGPE